MSADLVILTAEQLSVATPEEREEYRRYLILEAVKRDDPEAWLRAIAPSFVKTDFGPHHRKFWQWVWGIDEDSRPRPFIAIWGRGGAKALRLDEEVPTPTGWLRIGDVSIGDRVLDERGTPCTVVDLSPVEWRSAYRVTFKGGASVVVSGDHLWSVLDRPTRRMMRRRDGGIVEGWGSWSHEDRPQTACEVPACGRPVRRRGPDGERWCGAHHGRFMRHGDPLAGGPTRKRVEGEARLTGRTSYGARTLTTEQMLEEGLLDGREWRFAVPTCGAWDLPEVDLPIDPYVLGMWLGDGTTTSGAITVGHEDAVATRALLEARWGEMTSSTLEHAVTLRPVGLNTALKVLGVRGDKHVPEMYLRASAKQRADLLAGLCDSDGSVHRNAVTFANTNHRLALAVHELAVSLGWRASISEGRAMLDGRDCGPVWRVRIAAPPAEVFHLPRKREGGSGADMALNRDLHYVTSIERLPDAQVRCLVVDSPNHLFLAGRSAVPTHNSSSAEMSVLALGARGKRHYCLYVSETQDQADDHVGNIAALMESEEVGIAYPEIGERLMGKFGQAKGWKRNRIRTATGFTVDAVGLDTATRGVKLDAERPDIIVLDDIDSEHDSDNAVEKKIKTITRALIPSGAPYVAILGIQNKVHDDSIFARLADGRADFLRNRILSGPIPTVWGFGWVVDTDCLDEGETITVEDVAPAPLTPEQEEAAEQEREDDILDDGTKDNGVRPGLFRITEGKASWVGQDLPMAQDLLNNIGLTAFLAECQHETIGVSGEMFDHIPFASLHVSEAELPVMRRVVTWVDPAVTSTTRSDSQGISTSGLGVDGNYYRLFSWEGRTTPLDAIVRALRSAIEWGAESVGIETDQGGDTWESVYREACEILRNTERTAEEGGGFVLEGPAPHYASEKAGASQESKVSRAQHMLVDYERGKFRHLVGTHLVLELALHRFPKVKPFDLVDANYWSWYDLAKGAGRKRSRASTAAKRSLPVPSYN